ncbi:proteasome assembly chaperone family protein [Candidatus Woesearchaeota archaeon]|nr:proteasome assembly chaperone family protein [Candidatus Woesearchaeota archaeon]
MEMRLKKKPTKPTIIGGFPGFGLVGTIATEFLLSHLQTEPIGKIWMTELPPTLAIHEGKLVEPIGIFYNRKHNLVIVHAITATGGMEWQITSSLLKIAKQMKAKELISLEGVHTADGEDAEPKTFYYTNRKTGVQFEKIGVQPLKEGIIIGITASIILAAEKFPITALFVESHSQMPDSKAAAKLIESLDKYLKLDVDYTPLIKLAEQFEDKLRKLMEQNKLVQDERNKKSLSYVG